jgi:hypothetical protein
MMRTVLLKAMLAFALVALGDAFSHTASAADVQIYKISRGRDFQQRPERVPTNVAVNAFTFEATVLMNEPGSVSSATIKPPKRTARTLRPDSDRELLFVNRASQRKVIDERFPTNGNYTFTISTRNDGQRSLRLPMRGAYPSAPFVHYLVELQRVNPKGHLVVSWQPFANGTAFDFIRLRIEATNGAPAWESRGLDGTATRAIIEPDELRPGTTYNATLLFEKFVTRDTNSYPGAVGIVSHYARTRFTITTTSDGPADVERYELSKGRRLEQEDTGEPDPDAEDFIFLAEVRAREPGLVVAASLITTLETTVALVPDALREEFEFSRTASEPEIIEALFPPGNFVFDLQTVSDGNRRVGLWFDSNDYPPDPTLNFDLAQEVSPDAPFIVSWVPWATGTRDDFIQVRIEDEAGNPVFETPDFDDRDALSGRATSVTIPAGRLRLGVDYDARLTFRRFNRLNWFDYPGALGISSTFASTRFELETTRPDLEEYSIARGRGFRQESDTSTIPDPNDEFIFDAQVEGSSSNAISSVTLVTPRGLTIPMVPNPPDEFEFSDTAPDEPSFNAVYPPGNYTFNVQGLRGPLSVVLNVPNAPYPPSPRAHLSALGNPGTNVPVTLTWDRWSDGTTNDFIRVRIEDDDGNTFETPNRGDIGALDGLATSVTIPPGFFQFGQDYEGRIRFERFVVEDETTLPGAEGTVSYFSRTDFEIEAVGPDANDYRIERGRRFEQETAGPPIPDANDEFEFNAEVQGSARNLVLSATLRTPPGADIPLVANRSRDEFEFTDNNLRTQAELDTIYPPGLYTFTVQSVNDGTTTNSLDVPASEFPPVPHVLFDPNIAVPGNRPLVLRWDPWSDGTGDDLIRLRIENDDDEVVFDSSSDLDDPLDGGSTSVTIPAGKLAPGTYEVQLVFSRFVVDEERAGADFRVAYFSRTDFEITVNAADFEDFRIERGHRFEQTTAGQPLPDPDGGFEFNAEMQASAPLAISTATLRTPPPGADIALQPNSTFDEFEFSDEVNTQAEFDTLYPAGRYSFAIQGLQGSQEIFLDVPATNYPPAPHVQFDPNTAIPADQPLVLRWDAWPDGAASDFIQLHVEGAGNNVIFETPDRGDKGAFNGLATFTLIPAGTLVPGETYAARLVFERIVHTDESTGAEGRVTHFARTDFDIETVPSDVEDYRIERGRRFEQTTAGFPVPDPGDEFEFNAEVQGSAPNLISSAILTTPPGTNIVLDPNDDFDEFEFSDEVSTQAEFDNLYPGGTYTFTFQGANQGTQTIPLIAPPSDFPPAPHVQFDPQTEIAADENVELRWDFWAGSSADDFIQLRIEDANNNVVFETPDRGEAGALNGFATSVIIPAGTLAPIQRYEGRLVFERIVLTDETTVPGAEGRVIHFARTDFDIETSGGDVEDYRIERGRRFEQTTAALPVPDPGDEFEFNAEVQGSAPNLITFANLRTPPTAVIVLEPNNDFDEFEFSDQVSTQAEFDTLYPAGTYSFIVQSVNQATQTIPLDVPVSDFPPAPHVQFDPGTEVPANQSLLFFWDAWVGGTADDFIQLRVEDADNNVIFETPDRGDAGALNGLSTATEIPAGTLVPGRVYEGRLVFEHIVLTDDTSVPGAEGRVTYFGRTDFDIETVPPDVQEYEVFKEHVYVQTSNGPPAATEFVFRALVEAESDVSVLGAAITPPTGLQAQLVQGGGGDEFALQDSYASQEVLDANYPDGEYAFMITGVNDGSRFIPVTITGAMYPSAPQLSDYDAAQSINAGAPFVLAWNPFLDGTAQDHIDVQIEDSSGNEVFDTPGHGNDGALDGLATSVTIPPFTLQPGQAYEARILFQKILRADDSGYPGVVGRVGYSARTFAGIATALVANPVPRIQSYQKLGDGSLQFNVITLDGATYQIQGSPNMIDWTTLGTLSATSGLSTFTVPPPTSVGGYFYRAALIR